jgi:predicted SprT family Zn-dependent metalloprotease
LQRLYKECLNELKAINLNFDDEEIYGKIDIKIAKRNAKRYGCCKQENPDKTTLYRKNRRIYYSKFYIHHIEISKWLMDLNDDIIKNTIIHELIYCIPNCNNHGKEFKSYANLIKENLGYNITRLGNKEEDYKKSNLSFKQEEKQDYKYLIKCKKCGQSYYRKRMVRNFTKKYVCGKCRGKLEILCINP